MLVFVLIAITNLCVGFALAIWLGQGPRSWYALLLPGKQETGLIEIAPLADADPPSQTPQQPEEEEPVVVSLMEISTEDLAKKTPPPKPRPIAEPAAKAEEEEEESFATDFATDLVTKVTPDKTPEPAAEPANEDEIESMSFNQLLDQTESAAASEAEADEDDEDGSDTDSEVLTGGDIDALLSKAGNA
ncbi:MAG: hypothetical protein WDZ51_09680 [Pirellulaceae bacterium]